MTENEAIGQLKYMYKTCMDEKCKHKGQCDLCCESKDMAIQALEEIQQYRAIGTIGEFEALKEKSVAKKSEWEYCRKENIVTCKNCSYEHYLGTYHQYATRYCPNCGCEMET